jgi:hypothetical protein
MGVVKTWRWYVTAILLVAAVPVLGAEVATPSKEGQEASPEAREKVQDSRKLLEEVLMARLTKELALDEEQTVLMVRHLAEYREKMAALRRDRMQVVRALKQAVRESKDEAQIASLLEQLLGHDEKAALARRELLEPRGLELTTWQQARLALFVNDFEGDMRRLLKQAQERRMNAGGKPARKSGDAGDSGAKENGEGAPE